MSLKTERLEVRVDAATKARIEVAAARLDRLAQRERKYRSDCGMLSPH